MMDPAYFQRWRNSNELEKLHREFHAKTLPALELNAAYQRMGYTRQTIPSYRHASD